LSSFCLFIFWWYWGWTQSSFARQAFYAWAILLVHCPYYSAGLHLFVFGSTGVWTQGFVLARQMTYHLGHVSNPFLFCYFLDRVLLVCPGQPGLRSYLCFPHSCGDRHILTLPSFLLVGIGSWGLFAWSCLEPDLPNSISQIPRSTDINHHAQFIL
jgi:hypothetical protein